MKAYGHHKYTESPSKVDAREAEVQLEDQEACQWQKKNNEGKYCNFDSLWLNSKSLHNALQERLQLIKAEGQTCDRQHLIARFDYFFIACEIINHCFKA